jgi:hypothetical protein
MEETPRPSRLDERDPGKAEARDIREEVDLEIDHYGRDLHDLVLLVSEDRWAEFLKLAGCEADGEATRYKGVVLKPGPVTAVVAQEGF